MIAAEKDRCGITVHNSRFKTLLDQDASPNFTKDNGNHTSSYSANHPAMRSAKRTSSGISKHIKSWLSEQSIRLLQEKVDFESSAVKNMYECLLENEGELQMNMNEYLHHTDEMNEHKRKLLNKKWHERTYLPLNSKIDEEMNCKKFYDFDRQKRALYDKYLGHRNKKGHVFLDVISMDEYDPMSLNVHRPGPLKATVPKLEDPLLYLENKRNAEDRSILACDSGRRFSDSWIDAIRLPKLPLVPLGRHGTTCSTWLGMKQRDIQSADRVRSQGKMNGTLRNHSNAPLHEVKEKVTDSEIFDRKNGWKKRRQFPKAHNTADLLI